MPTPAPDPREAAPDSDGMSPQTAIRVGGVREEYQWVARNIPGARFLGQALVVVEGRPFDKLTFALETGEQREVFFDISGFYGRDQEEPASEVPCPHCGAALRTVHAKQCFACGMDWHDPANVVRRGEG